MARPTDGDEGRGRGPLGMERVASTTQNPSKEGNRQQQQTKENNTKSNGKTERMTTSSPPHIETINILTTSILHNQRLFSSSSS